MTAPILFLSRFELFDADIAAIIEQPDAWSDQPADDAAELLEAWELTDLAVGTHPLISDDPRTSEQKNLDEWQKEVNCTRASDYPV